VGKQKLTFNLDVVNTQIYTLKIHAGDAEETKRGEIRLFFAARIKVPLEKS